MSPIYQLQDADGRRRTVSRIEAAEQMLPDGVTPDEVRASSVYQDAGFAKRREIDALFGTQPSGESWRRFVAKFR